MSYYISIFKSAREVMRCDERCRELNLATKIVPVPEKYSSSCGMSIEILKGSLAEFKSVVEELNLEVNIYEK